MIISVALCTFNGRRYIEEQLNSIINQTLKVNEIIICDDCSSDDTLTIVMKIAKKYPNIIKIYQNEVNLKSNKNFQKAVSLCTGDYVFFSDQDDIWKETKVEKIIAKFNKDHNLEVIFSNAELINDCGEIFPETSLWDSVAFFNELITNKTNLNFLLVHKSNMVTGATMCIKKEIINKVLPIPVIENMYHDEWISMIAAAENKLDFINEKLIYYRVHSNQQTGKGIIFNRKKINKNLVLSKNVLGIIQPKTYTELKRLANNYHRNYERHKNISSEAAITLPINFNTFAASNLELFLETEKKIKHSYPTLYFFRKRIDTIKGKRKT